MGKSYRLSPLNIFSFQSAKSAKRPLNCPSPLICSIKPLNPLNHYELNLLHLKHGRLETGDRRCETADRRQETGDGRREAGDRRQDTGDRIQKTGDRIQETGDRRQVKDTEDRRGEMGKGSTSTRKI